MWHCNCSDDVEPLDDLHATVHRTRTDYDSVVLLRRNGRVTNRFGDGTTGVPLVIRALVQDHEEDPFCPACESFCSWSFEDGSPTADELDDVADMLMERAKERGELAEFTNGDD